MADVEIEVIRELIRLTVTLVVIMQIVPWMMLLAAVFIYTSVRDYKRKLHRKEGRYP